LSKKHKKSKGAYSKVKSGQEKSHVSVPERAQLMIPSWGIALAWFLAAIPLAAVWYYWDKSKFGILWSIFAAVVLVALAITFHIHNDLTEKEIAARKPVYFGFLEPSNEQPLESSIPANAVSLLLGNDLQVLSMSANQRIFQAQGRPFLTIGIENGRIWISTTITDSQNQTVVRIIKNEFQAFAEHAFNPTQPDAHSLLVRDATGEQVLKVRFLNPRRILIYGRFVLPNSRTVIINDDGIRFPEGGGVGHLTLDMMAAPNAGVINFN
jgi:hypothetical protein